MEIRHQRRILNKDLKPGMIVVTGIKTDRMFLILTGTPVLSWLDADGHITKNEVSESDRIFIWEDDSNFVVL